MTFRSKKVSEPSRRQRSAQLPQARVPQTFSYRALRSDGPTAELAGRRGRTAAVEKRSLWRFWGRRAGFVIGTITLAVCLGQILALSPTVKIEPLDPASNAYLLHSPAMYQQTAAALFSRSFFNRNKITVDTAQVAAGLKKAYPELSEVSIVLPLLGHRPIVYLQAVEPAFELIESGQPLLIGSDGRMVGVGSQVAGSARQSLPVVTDHANLTPRPGATVLPSSDVTFITTVLMELHHAGIVVGKLDLPAAASEFDVAVKGQPFIVKFNMQTGTARQQAGTFLATWGYLQKKHTTPTHYIDVRLDGRAYYK